MALGDERDLGVAQKMVQRIAGQHDVRRSVRQSTEKLGQIAGRNFGPARPNRDMRASPLDGRLRNVDALILLDVCLAKGVRRQPRVAAAKIDDSQRLTAFCVPSSRSAATISACRM